MGFRFRKSINLGGGAKINFNKKSVGLSVGGKGFRYSVNSNGRRTKSAGIPGTGLYYTTSSGGKKGKKMNNTNNNYNNPNMPDNNNNGNKKGVSEILIWVLLIIFFPVGLYLVWAKSNWSKKKKIIVTVIIAILALIGLFMPGSEDSDYENANAISTTQESITQAEDNTSLKVDEILKQAKEDSATSTDETVEKAVSYIDENISTCFESNDKMEQVMYYGALLDYKYDDSNKLSILGMNAVQAVKYVYRGVESVDDEATQHNINSVKETLKELKAETTTETTTKETTTETTTKATTTKKTTTTQAEKSNSKIVYVTPTGEKYHFSKSCAGKNAMERELDDVKDIYDPCKKCAY